MSNRGGPSWPPEPQPKLQTRGPARFDSPTRSSTIKSVLATVKQKTIQRVQILEQRAKDVSRAALACRGRPGYRRFCSGTYGASLTIRDVLGDASQRDGSVSYDVDQVAALCSDQRDPRLVASTLRVAFNQGNGTLAGRKAVRSHSATATPFETSYFDRTASSSRDSTALIGPSLDIHEAVRVAFISRALAHRTILQPSQIVVVDQSPHRSEWSQQRRSQSRVAEPPPQPTSDDRQQLAQRVANMMEVNRRLAEAAMPLPPPAADHEVITDSDDDQDALLSLRARQETVPDPQQRSSPVLPPPPPSPPPPALKSDRVTTSPPPQREATPPHAETPLERMRALLRDRHTRDEEHSHSAAPELMASAVPPTSTSASQRGEGDAPTHVGAQSPAARLAALREKSAAAAASSATPAVLAGATDTAPRTPNPRAEASVVEHNGTSTDPPAGMTPLQRLQWLRSHKATTEVPSVAEAASTPPPVGHVQSTPVALTPAQRLAALRAAREQQAKNTPPPPSAAPVTVSAEDGLEPRNNNSHADADSGTTRTPVAEGTKSSLEALLVKARAAREAKNTASV